MPTSPVWLLRLGCALALALAVGCSTPSNLPRLRAQPDYEDALRCAPVFTRDALTTISALENAKK
jgi:hypothetical protein